MAFRLDSRKKIYILWGVIGVVLLIFLKICSPSPEPPVVIKDQEKYHREVVNPLVQEMNRAGLVKQESDYNCSTEDIRQRLEDYSRRVESSESECRGIYDFLRERSGGEQPESVCREWQTKVKRLENLQADVKRVGQEAQDALDRQVKEWESNAANFDATLQAKIKNIDDLVERSENCRAEMGRRVNRLKPKWLSRKRYEMDIRKLKLLESSLKKPREELVKKQVELLRDREKIITSDGRLNRESPDIQELEDRLRKICAVGQYDVAVLQEPRIKPEPPPPPLVPDVSIATTGDLAEELAKPLVERWLTERGATPLQGSSFVWSTPDDVTMEIEVNAPGNIHGREPGKLRIRISSESDAETIFSWLRSGREKADLVLTGRTMSTAQRMDWLPRGRTLEDFDAAEKGTYRVRVCSDALLFFPGEGSEIECLNAETRNTLAKVYSRDDAGRMEAASIFGFTPVGSDAVAGDTRGRTIDSLRGQYRDRIILGTWHRDRRRSDEALRPVRGHELSYSSGISMDSDRVASAYRRFLKEYRSKGCHPSEPTINAGRYAYSYDINFYRSTTPKPGAAAGEDLLVWAGDARSEKLAAIVRKCGFVPAMPKEPNADDQLTNEDLPIDRLLQKLPEDFGYTRGETVWVRGTRFDIPLFYRVGDSKVAVDPTYISGVTKALEYMRKLTRGRRACLVLVGHADPQYGKKLDAGERSWNFNDRLSRERADVIYTDFFSKECPDSSTLTHVTLGCSWAFPVRDIDLSKGIAEQEDALNRCRRVEVFVVFPLVDDVKGAGEH